jgi:hypothetical protein
MVLGKIIANCGKKINSALTFVSDETAQIRAFARDCGFVKRFTSRLNGVEFVQTLLIEAIDGEKNTLRNSLDTLMALKPTSAMSIQGLRKRMNTSQAVNLMKWVFEKIFQSALSTSEGCKVSLQQNSRLLNFFLKFIFKIARKFYSMLTLKILIKVLEVEMEMGKEKQA